MYSNGFTINYSGFKLCQVLTLYYKVSINLQSYIIQCKCLTSWLPFLDRTMITAGPRALRPTTKGETNSPRWWSCLPNPKCELLPLLYLYILYSRYWAQQIQNVSYFPYCTYIFCLSDIGHSKSKIELLPLLSLFWLWFSEGFMNYYN